MKKVIWSYIKGVDLPSSGLVVLQWHVLAHDRPDLLVHVRPDPVPVDSKADSTDEQDGDDDPSNQESCR